MKHLFQFLVLSILFASCDSIKNKDTEKQFVADPADYVNPFIGTDAHGHTYPGASLPFGMVQLSPDTRLEGWDGCSGYHYSDSIVFGFSHTALSGTGVPDYSDILFMPTTGKVLLNNGAENDDEGYASRFSHNNEEAKVGYYKTTLDDYSIDVELTASKRVGFHKYTFPADQQNNVIIDLDHRDKVVDSWIRVVNDHEIEGFRRSTAWANDQHIYFVAVFSSPVADFGLALNEEITGKDFIQGENVKGYFSFEELAQQELLVKVGLSAVSAEGARKNLEAEIPHWDFEKVKIQAKNEWNKELSKIQVKGGSDEQKITFYTALYHAFLVPNLFQDVDGQFRGRDLEIHQTKDFDYYTVFSLWDTFRGEHPLFTLTQQKRTIDFINTMITQYEQGGRLPVWELAANETECMIGYHSIPVIVDAYMKGIRGFDAEKAFEAMKHSAELDHFGLSSYKENGYIPADDESESVSKTLEYAYDDWCIAIMAKELGKLDDYEKYLKRAQSYKNLFDPSTGFMRAKMNGRWFEPFDPKEVNFNYTEANSWQYSFFVPQDINGLVNLLGGREVLISRLDQLFSEASKTTGREQSDITGLIGQYAHGNEPSHHMAYLYNYLGQPWKTQQRTRQIMNELYSHKADGLCGNEDCGQMSAWYVLSAMGFSSVTPGDVNYTIGSPLFDEVKLNHENGKSFTIIARNNSPENMYIQSASLNGITYTKSYISHFEILNSGELIFEMGNKSNENWGTNEADLPVSEIKDFIITPVPFVNSGKRTFIDTTTVSLESLTEDGTIFYTLDNSIPASQSIKYTEPFILNESAQLKAFVQKEGSPTSAILSAEFYKIPVG
ncbi:MAG: GH92 family glycosyl hydrolase, partial [Bacteroidales bacterium]